MKFQSPIIAQDAANQVAHDHLRRQGRSSPRIIDHSIVTAKFSVGPDTNGDGGNSVFRVTHGLRHPPNLVVPMRWHARRTDTAEYAGVLLGTCDPISDDTYSYLSIALPQTVIHGSGVLDSSIPSMLTVTVDSSLGVPRRGIGNYEYYNGMGPNHWIADAVSGQDVKFYALSNAYAALTIHYSIFFGFPPNTVVTVDVYSAIMDGLALPSKTLGPSQAHSAGENVTAPLGQIFEGEA